MTTVRVTIDWASPILMPQVGPLVPDTWLLWAQALRTRSGWSMPQDPDWDPALPLPLAIDPVSGLWAVSALTFPDPGVVTANTGYRNAPNSGDLTNQVHLFSAKDGSSGPYHAAIYDLTGWSTPRSVFWAELAEDPAAWSALEGLLTILRYSGVGRKHADGYGAIRAVHMEADPGRSAVWEQGQPRRPIPVHAVKTPLEAPRFVFQTAGPRWHGRAILCYGPPVETWTPRLYQKPPRASSTVVPT